MEPLVKKDTPRKRELAEGIGVYYFQLCRPSSTIYIKSIKLQCFKNYQNRILEGFDTSITAITGLHGTGKSIIVDSICFVLGLQKMTYQSNTGVTESTSESFSNATVSITFDTSHKKRYAPCGYRKDETTITRTQSVKGKDKYMINNDKASKKRVLDYFRSVKLDVPHFVVMQGQVSKILTMQPSEILSMIKEAVGITTGVGISTKELNDLEQQKKEKEDDIRRLEYEIQNETAPNLPRLQRERLLFEEYQNISNEINRTNRLIKAYKYTLMNNNFKKIELQIDKTVHETNTRKGHINWNNHACDAIEKGLRSLKKLEKECSKTLGELKKKLSPAQWKFSSAMDLREAEACVADNDTKLQRYLEQSQAELQPNRARADQVVESLSGVPAASESSAAALKAAYLRYQAVCSDLEDKLRQRSQARSEAGSRVSCAALDLEAYEARLLELRAGYEPAYAQDQAAVADCERRRQDLQSKMQDDAARHATLAAARRALQAEVSSQRAAVDVLAARLQRCDFRYDPPEPNFDSNRVHGTIAHLIEKSAPEYYTALETVAGHKLYTVVVDTMQTASLLRKCGTRTRLISLDTIRGAVINTKTVAAAQEIGGGAEAVQLALSLVPNAAALAPALRWVFGRTLVCRDLNTALLVYYHPRVRCRCVTLAGDVCELIDGGTVTSAGAGSRGPSTLQQLAELRAAEGALHDHERRLQAVDAEHAVMEQTSQQYEEHMRRLDIEQQSLAERLTSSVYTNLQAQIEDLEAQVSEKRSALQHEAAQLEETDHGYQEILREYENAKATLQNAYEVYVNENGNASRGPANEISRKEAQLSRIMCKVDMCKNRIDELRVVTRDAELRCMWLESTLPELNKDAKAQQDAMAVLHVMQPWILEERRFFGEEGGPYDFLAHDVAGADARLAQLWERFNVLNSNFNATEYVHYARQAVRYKGLLRRKREMRAELENLENEMRLLIERRRSALRFALDEINLCLMFILPRLWPEARAVLKPRPGSDEEDGLEICVQINGLWTFSMDLLSSGHKWLVALSLLLAIMLFRPAPLYILDAVDTESLQCRDFDVMLRNIFPHSQFIIVSKSDEMCSSANVQFRLNFEKCGSEGVQRMYSGVVPNNIIRAREKQQCLRQVRAEKEREREANERRMAREEVMQKMREQAREKRERARERRERARQAPAQPRRARERARQSPAQPRRVRVRARQAPAQPRRAPAQPRQAPAQPRQAPAQPRQAPAQPRRARKRARQAPAQPRQALTQPRQALAQPRQALAQPRQALAQPRQALAQPRQALAQPRQALAQPRQALAQPRQALAQPRQALAQPRQALAQPRQALAQPSA